MARARLGTFRKVRKMKKITVHDDNEGLSIPEYGDDEFIAQDRYGRPKLKKPKHPKEAPEGIFPPKRKVRQ